MCWVIEGLFFERERERGDVFVLDGESFWVNVKVKGKVVCVGFDLIWLGWVGLGWVRCKLVSWFGLC